jgi:hypothetical protein
LRGITVPPKDSAALAASIQFLLENETLRKIYGEAARIRVRERFTIEAVTDSLLQLYGQLNPRFAKLAPKPPDALEPTAEKFEQHPSTS